MAGIKGSVNEARFSVIVMGENLPMDKVSEELGLTPTRTIRKGERLVAALALSIDQDEWICTAPLTDPMGGDEKLCQILDQLTEHREGIEKVMEYASFKIVLHVQSDYAQMSFRLVPSTMDRLLKLGLPLEISSVSWGEVF